MASPPTYRAVIADDANHLRLLLRTVLERSGRFDVVGEARNGKEAIAETTRLTPDLTLLDLKMPIMDGLEALPQIRAAVPSTLVVVLSGLEADAMAAQALAAGAAAYLVKDLNIAHVVEQLLSLLDGTAEAAPASVRLPEDPASPGRARDFVRKTLVRWSHEAAVEDAELLATELVTNAVVHAKSAVEVRVRRLSDRVRVEVADTGQGALHLREADDEDVSGRGLLLVEGLSRAWGTISDGATKIVWFEI
jgi:DNA-binding NarL/FixJ family response regulator